MHSKKDFIHSQWFGANANRFERFQHSKRFQFLLGNSNFVVANKIRSIEFNDATRIYLGTNFRIIKLNLTRTSWVKCFYDCYLHIRVAHSNSARARRIRDWPSSLRSLLIWLIFVNADFVIWLGIHAFEMRSRKIKCKLSKKLSRKRTFQSIVLIRLIVNEFNKTSKDHISFSVQTAISKNKN